MNQLRREHREALLYLEANPPFSEDKRKSIVEDIIAS